MDTVDNRKKSLLLKQSVVTCKDFLQYLTQFQKAKLIVVSGRLELKWTNQKKYLPQKSSKYNMFN